MHVTETVNGNGNPEGPGEEVGREFGRALVGHLCLKSHPRGGALY